MITTGLTYEQKARLKADIFDWWYESKIADGTEPTDDEVEQFKQQLNNKGQTELIEMWNGTVAEWILSRDDIIDVDRDTDKQIDEIFATVTGDRSEQPHGYIGGQTSYKVFT